MSNNRKSPLQEAFFKFKGLELLNKDSAFKINTDGVLLASWIEDLGTDTILDVGCGTGVIALLIRKRFPAATLHAIDIDAPSIHEAQFNVGHNGLENITVCHSALQDYLLDGNVLFDHIISNPPFFQNATKPIDDRLSIAKHNDTLSFEDLCAHAIRLGTEKLKLSVVLPMNCSEQFVSVASKYDLSILRSMIVRGRKDKRPIRHLISLQKAYSGCSTDEELYLFEDDRRTKSKAYEELVKDIYL